MKRDDESNINMSKDNKDNKDTKTDQKILNSDDKYQSDGFEEIERRSGDESEFSEREFEEENEGENKQKDQSPLQLTSTIINTNTNTNTINNSIVNANRRNVSNTLSEGIQTKDTEIINKEKPIALIGSTPSKTYAYTNSNLNFNANTNTNAIRLLKEDPQLLLENITLQSELNRVKEENSYLTIEKNKIAKIKDNEVLILQEKLSTLAQQNFHLNKELDKLTKQISENKSKIDDYDNGINQLKAISNQNNKLKTNNESLMKLIDTLKQERLAMTSRLESIKAENTTFKQEKMYLLKKTMTQSELIKSLTTKNESNDKEIFELKEEKSTFINKLTSKDIEVERAFRSALEKEVNNCRNKYNQDLNELKESFNQSLTNKTKYISDHCDELKQRIYTYEKNLKEKSDQIDFLTLELNTKTSGNEEENAHLKLQLKIKIEDINRLTTLYNESIELIQLNQQEICSLKEKFEIIRNELINKESKYKEEVTAYKSKWIFEKEKNDDYAQMESELDKVICDSTLISTADEHSIDLMNRLNALPMNSKKRISQCIVLANKVKFLIIDNDNLKSANSLLLIENDKIKDESNAFESIAIKIKEPYEYLINKLQEKDIENEKLRGMVREKDKAITAVMKDNKRLEDKAKEIEDDLRIVLANRKQLESFESIVDSHIQENKNKWELIEWQKQQYELMIKKQNKPQVSDKLKVANWPMKTK